MKSFGRLTIAGVLAGWSLTGTLPAADFPRWRGVNGNGSAGETAEPLAASWDEARVAWVSETLSPHPWNYSVVRGRTQWPRTVLGNGGYCMPAIAGGKVYVGFWRPSGTAEATTAESKYPQMWVNSGLKAYRLIDADMVIVRLDAATGRADWEAVWPGTEMNHIELYGGHNNLCVSDGRVVAIGGAGRIYAADAASGARLWSAPLGPSAAQWDRFKDYCKQKRLKSYHVESLPATQAPPHPQGGSLYPHTYNTCVAIADGVAVSGEWSARDCLVGFDVNTGRELWRQPRACGGLVPPLRWTHQGQDYLIVAASAIHCLTPKTGAILWSAGQLHNLGYDSATPAIEGDCLVSHGPGGEGWVCYRLSPTGAEKAWSLGPAYLGSSYIAPIIHRGHAWLNFARGAGTKGLTECRTDGDSAAIACVELATGKVLSEFSGMPMNSVCPGPVAMGDKLIYQGGEYVWMADIRDPAKPRFLGTLPMPVNLCSSASAADGLVFFRGAERLVVCLDVRRQAAPRAPYALELTDALGAGQTPRFHLAERDGRFPQSWATCPPRHLCPDPLEAGALRREGDRVAGRVKAYLNGTLHEYRLDFAAANGVVAGEYEDLYTGVPLAGPVTGTMRAPAVRNARFEISWPRHWIGGQNQGHEHKMNIVVADGKVTGVTFRPRLPDSNKFSATAESHTLAFDGQTLAGQVVAQVRTDHIGIPGRYTLEFATTVRHGLVAGQVKSTLDGKPATTHGVGGGVEVPATEPVSSAHAVFQLDLKDSIRYANDTTGQMDTRLWFTARDGQVVGGQANARQNAGLQRADFSAVRVAGNRVTGVVETWIKADGYVLRADSHNRYALDLTIAGGDVTGTYDGAYDVRTPRKGALTGTYVAAR